MDAATKDKILTNLYCLVDLLEDYREDIDVTEMEKELSEAIDEIEKL